MPKGKRGFQPGNSFAHGPEAQQFRPDREWAPPNVTPAVSLFGKAVLDYWADVDEKPRVDPSLPFRASQAGDCLRAMRYYRDGVPRSNDKPAGDQMALNMGRILHDEIQQVLADTLGKAGWTVESEVPCKWKLWSGSADNLLTSPSGLKIGLEHKTVGKFAWEKSTGIKFLGRKPQADGVRQPSASHRIQAAIYGRALDVDQMVIIYWAKEAPSRKARNILGLGEYLGVQEWRMERDVIVATSDWELERVRRLEQWDDLPAHEVPMLTSEVGPDTVRRFNADAFPCSYCDWVNHCSTRIEKGEGA